MAVSDQEPTSTSGSAGTPAVGRPTVLVLSGRIATDDVAGLCEQLGRLLDATDAPVVACDVGDLAEPDVGDVEALARMQLVARRRGRTIRFRYASGSLRALLAATGLDGALPCCPGPPAPDAEPSEGGGGEDERGAEPGP